MTPCGGGAGGPARIGGDKLVTGGEKGVNMLWLLRLGSGYNSLCQLGGRG